MELSKNKLILIGVTAFFSLFIIFIVINLNGAKNKTSKVSKEITIWTINNSDTNFSQLIASYKEYDTSASSTTFNHKNFNSYNDYQLTLLYALANGKGPDIFLLNNSEKLFLDDKITGIDPSIIVPSNFRKNYHNVFANDLIETVQDESDPDKKIEFLVGIPTGFETLGLFYDRKKFLGANLENWAGLGTAISDIKKKNSNTIPLGIGNGTTVYQVENILTQFFANTGKESLSALDVNDIRGSISNYLLYGDAKGKNGYDTKYEDMKSYGRNNIDMFSRGEVSMIIGYPSMLNEIDKKGYSKNFLVTDPFPKSIGGEDKTAISYNYFVVNKDAQYLNDSIGFLAYLASEKGADDYFELFPESIPARVSLLNKIDNKINENYNITYKDFLRDGTELVSFDRGVKAIYDTEVGLLLDDSTSAIKDFEKLKTKLDCKSLKLADFDGLDINCDN